MALDRNFWDPPDKPGVTTQKKRARLVNICIYHVEGSTKTKETIQQDVEGASAIWCKADINIQAIHQGAISRPEVRADVINCQAFQNGLPTPIADLTNTRTGQGCDDLLRTIAVYYVPGRFLMDGPFVSGCSYSECQDTGAYKPFIIMTDEAGARVLAHEIGHLLFTRLVGTTCMNDDPDPNHYVRPDGTIDTRHNKDPENLMVPVGDNETANKLTQEQIDWARGSKLVQTGDLAVGFEAAKGELKVEFLNMHVYATDDGFLNEDLETRWHFAVNGVNKDWDNNDLGTNVYDLKAAGLVFDVKNLKVSENLVIEVTGTEVDTVDDDILPPYKATWTKAEKWGANNPTQTSPLLHNDEIDCTIEYSVTLIAEPGEEEPPFRTVCEIL